MTTNFGPDDLLFYKEQQGGNDIIMSGGYSVDSYLLKNGISPIQTINTLESGQIGAGKQVSSIFENLAVPAGLYFDNQKSVQDMSGGARKSMDHKMLPDNIFDEFMRLIEFDKHKKRQRRTRRSKDVPNKRTRRLRDK
jgi:hypothetical protein